MDPRRHAGITRTEASAQARRRRAMAHIEKVRNQHQRRPLPLRHAAAAVAVLALAAGLLAGAAGTFARPVERIRVRGVHWVPGGEIAAALRSVRGAAPGTVDTALLAEQLETHPWIQSAQVLALPSGTLLVAVSEREPVAVLAGEKRWVVDAEGVPFAPAPARGTEGLLEIQAAASPQPGQPDADLARALELSRSLARVGLPAPTRVAIAAPEDPEGLSLVLPGVAARVVLGRHDLEARVADLGRLLEAGLPELSGAARIDLRFEDQAVLDVAPSLEGAEQAAASRGGAAPSNSRRSG